VDAISAVKQGEATIVRVEGEKVGALIGRRGETMEALSYLAGLVANRTGGDYEKIGLDVAGYRSKREQDLALLAKRIGSRVQKTGRSQMLEPMNPYERRIIHSVIGEMENLSSESTGEGANRRVVVRSTAAGATDGGEGEQRPLRSNNNRSRGTRGGRGGSSRASGAAPRKDAPAAAFTPRRKDAPMPKQDRPERKAPTGEAPVAVERSTTIDDSFDLPLYGKIEF
ncbi:MAG: R3H domain-containing nucleic acid-binding protein, partial [Pygmaiobacter sp.]